MSGESRFMSRAVKGSSDVETWHPDLGILVRDDAAFICFDDEGSAIHISRSATSLLALHRHVDAIFESLRNAAAQVLAEQDGADDGPRPRLGAKVADPADGSCWSVHLVRTRHDWPVAIAVSETTPPSHRPPRLRDRLTRRELEVATLIAEGARAKNVAATLDISVHTARRHTENVFSKLGVHSRVELTHLVFRGQGAGSGHAGFSAGYQLGAAH